MNLIKVADEHILLAGISNLQIHDVTAFLKELRSVNKRVAVQAVNADLVAGMQHVMGVLYQAVEAKKRRILLSKRIEVDILLRLGCTDQIDRALVNIGIKEGRNNVLVIALGRINNLRMVRKYIAENYGIDDNVLAPSKRRLKTISTLHGIGKVELDTLVNNNNKLSGLLVELASLL